VIDDTLRSTALNDVSRTVASCKASGLSLRDGANDIPQQKAELPE